MPFYIKSTTEDCYYVPSIILSANGEIAFHLPQKNKIFNRSSNFPWVIRAADDKLMTLSLYEGPLAKQEKSFEIHAIYWGL